MDMDPNLIFWNERRLIHLKFRHSASYQGMFDPSVVIATSKSY